MLVKTLKTRCIVLAQVRKKNHRLTVNNCLCNLVILQTAQSSCISYSMQLHNTSILNGKSMIEYNIKMKVISCDTRGYVTHLVTRVGCLRTSGGTAVDIDRSYLTTC